MSSKRNKKTIRRRRKTQRIKNRRITQRIKQRRRTHGGGEITSYPEWSKFIHFGCWNNIDTENPESSAFF